MTARYFKKESCKMEVDDLINRLEFELSEKSYSYEDRCEELIRLLFELNDASCIERLLILLCYDPNYDLESEDTDEPELIEEPEHDALMFKIVEVLESFSRDLYVRDLCKHLETTLSKPTMWLFILFTRLLDSVDGVRLLSSQIAHLSQLEKMYLSVVLDEIKTAEDSYAGRCDRLLSQLI